MQASLRFSVVLVTLALSACGGIDVPRVADESRSAPVAQPSVILSLNLTASAQTEVTRTTTTGHVFISDSSRPTLGDAWRDESGMIWGDMVRFRVGSTYLDQICFESHRPIRDGIPCVVDYGDALEYCESIGAALPTVDDYKRLRSYMGASLDSPTGYKAQVLPNLDLDIYFFTSTLSAMHDRVFTFLGRAGAFYQDAGNERLRCVAHSETVRPQEPEVDPCSFFLSEIARNADGSVRHMNRFQAATYCREQGSRLPTVRELAMCSHAHGAVGIRETSHTGVWTGDDAVQKEIWLMKRDGYVAIQRQYPSEENGLKHRAVDFYFNPSGYHRPAGDSGSYWFWSSSESEFHRAHVLYGINASIHSFENSNDLGLSSVRCAR